ncbi:hypothetical protein QBC42DRAFT_285070 [Cladorrhinum samala]|uniref:Uncharacterized protein n=1 Tax=Cladorrhinum samala TaxID=585594 RepID=A0AAV9HSN5_9PEZI|nr:hypothetical protein QBC42DRAFT_285070 [Cladorrhinum samala]
MASEGAPTQALIGAFTFGTVLYAASAAAVLYIKDHGSTVFRDSQRLVLVSFLISSALWATIDFITLLISTTSSSMPCQIGVIFATIFDQLARFSIEQFLLWALTNNGGKLSVVQLIPQILVLVRFLVGAVFVGFTRPQTDDFCVATTSALPIGVVVIAFDVVIIMLLIQKAYSSGPGSAKAMNPDRTKAITSVLLGLACWTASSIVMMLGLTSIPPAVRTAVPAAGLLVLIMFVTAGAWTLLSSRKSSSGMPEAPSPRRINISRDISTADSEYPPSRYEDIKEAAIRSSRTFVNPRDVPRVKDETSIGFPFALDTTTQQQSLPTATLPASGMVRNLDRSVSQKRGMFGFGPAAPAGKLTIGRPILQNTEEGNPFNKIAVVDLQEAAMAEKQRRERMQDSGNEIANRSAVRPMQLSAEEGLKRAVSTKRKEVASVSSRQSVFRGALQPEDTASTTSTQLSPAGDETRRRSPRPSPPVEEDQKSLSSEGAAKSMHGWPINSQDDTRPVTVLLQANLPQPIQRPGIRPSRMLPPSPDTPPAEPTKTPLQRRPTIGLPTNPRARGIQIPPDTSSQNKTIMFVNNIEYYDPAGVESIIQDASRQSMKGGLGRAASVVNRPRPIPRKPADSPLTATSPSHRRSKSGGSLIGRKSILNSTAGSPTRLPPLPTAPRSAGMPSRPHPNDTKSMTFDEKVNLLFPAPPSGNALRRRSSSVPELPPIPKSFMDITPSPSQVDESRRSNRTTKTSIKTESVLEVDEIPPKQGAVNTENEAGRNWLQAFEERNEIAQDGRKRKSSPVLPPAQVRASAWTETTDDRTQYDDGMTNWSSMNSPEVVIGIPVFPAPGLPASVRMPPRQDAQKLTVAPVANNRATTETLPIMLDAWTSEQVESRRSWLLEDEPADESDNESVAETVPEAAPEPKRISQGHWHRRVGDECPAFSERMEKTTCRKTPPTPLTLNVPIKKAIVIQSEPSPLESPEEAFEAIQAQLKKLEEPGVESTETPSKRLALLENLEKEMGMQVDHWKEMKHDIGRDSLSSVQTASPAVRRESVVSVANIIPESNKVSIGAERRASRLSRMMSTRSTRVTETSTRNSMRDSVSPQLSKWQKRLTEAQMEYLDARLVRESNVNFLQLSRAQLASPTPPDSDDSDAEVPPHPSQFVKKDTPEPSPEQLKALLWAPEPKESAAVTSLLWARVPRKVEEEALLPGLSVRPAQRKEMAPLKIESTQLWRKPYADVGRSTSGLWRPVWASAAPPAEPIRRSTQPAVAAPQSQKAPRPVTQRPPRRNKRVTLLPDILENPEPLPDNRGTLGIFQFPWGEKSDTASVQPRPVIMAMPGTMTSGGPPVKNELSEYSSSFFDEYDDDDDDEEVINEVNLEEDNGSDDGFDETTLWEIASLLKVENVPSNNDLFSLPSDDNSGLEDYLEEMRSDVEEESIVIGLGEPRELVFDQSRDSATLESSTLLMLEEAYQTEKTPSPKPAARIGLPANPRPAAPATTSEVKGVETSIKQGSSGLWNPPVAWEKSSAHGLFTPNSGRSEYRTTSEDPAAQYMMRKPRPADLKPLDKLASTAIWTLEAAKPAKRNWISSVAKPKQDTVVRKAVVSSGLWKPAAVDSSSAYGLFTPNSGRSEYRTTSENPAAQYMMRKPRPADLKPLDKLTSTDIWTLEAAKPAKRNWIFSVAKPKQETVVRNAVVSSGLWKPAAVDSSSAYGLFTLNSGRSIFRTTIEEPAAQNMSRKPRPAELKPLDKLTTKTLWTSSASKNTQRNWISGITRAKQEKKHRQVSPSEWQAALKEAISASYPEKKFIRVAATLAEWDAALVEAISLSYPPSLPKFDSSVRHPVFAAKSLVTKSEWFHPAATGYTYDIANIHPAFFGSLAITCPEDQVHPAISAYAAKKLRRQRSKASRTGSRSRSRSQSRSSSQIQVIPEDAPIPVPVPAIPRRDTIQAQIEALEQERLFVQRAAQEDYRRMISYSYVPDRAPAVVEEEEPIIPTVESLQRRLSQRIRDSLVLPKSSVPAHVSSMPSTLPASTPKPAPASVPAPPASPKMLWTPSVKPTEAMRSSSSSSSSSSSTDLWSSLSIREIPAISADEDADSLTRRNKGRKIIQKKQRRREILVQIAAVEAGMNPFERFEGMNLWGVVEQKDVRELEKDWLHTVCKGQQQQKSGKGLNSGVSVHHHSRKTGSQGGSGSKVILRF